MSDPSATPMMQQYRELKARDPEALLLFRMGDFYEMFFDDAEKASELLGLSLTTRDKGSNPVPMAGFPHPALQSYLARLVSLGVRAAVCEQVEDPKLAKGLVKRDIVRIVTPGTLTDDALLDPKASNYLAAAVESRGRHGLAWVELSTGKFLLAGAHRRELLDEIGRIAPAELVVSEQALDEPWLKLIRESRSGIPISARPSWDFQPEQSLKTLADHFRVTTLSGFGIADDSLETRAAGALLAYLRDTQMSSLKHLTRLVPFRRESVLALDETTRRSLELTKTLREGRREGSLLDVIDRSATAMGSRLLADWINAPLTDRAEIEKRLDAVEELVERPELRNAFRELLEKAHDLERLASRVGTGRASPRDLAALGKTLALLPAVKAKLTGRRAELMGELEAGLELCSEVKLAIEESLTDDPPLALKEGGLIKDGFHPGLDELREIARGGKTWIAKYQAEEIRRTGINSLKVGYNKVFGYYIEITHAHGARAPSDYIRKQTVKNAERYITPELKEYEDKVLRAEDRANELEYELFTTLRDRVSAETPRLVQAGTVLARLDALCALAELAARRGYARPEIATDSALVIEAGRHPVLDAIMSPGAFVPNDLAIGDDARIVLITGPNMAGKSTFIRQTALITLLAQMGSFVPARRAKIGIADRLFARVGASDELARGQSTFMVEMTETANILNNATSRSLVILDEIGRGTSTFDGISLAWAITEYIHDVIGCRTLFATHYHELTDLEKTKPALRNANVAVSERNGEIVFLHRIVPGGADQSYGIHVARIAGIPANLLDRARAILAFLEKQHQAEVPPSPQTPPPNAPIRKVKSAKSAQRSLFADLPDPLLVELRQAALESLSPEQAWELVRRLRELAN